MTTEPRPKRRARRAPTSPRVRYAVVGAGNIAQVAVLPAFAHAAKTSELVALVSGDERKVDALVKRYGVAHAGSYDQLEEILVASEADAVFVATPNTTHRSVTERAAALGVAVLCEKPLAESVAESEAMIRACEVAGVPLMTAYRLHFDEANLRAIELVQGGDLGDVQVFESTFTQTVRRGDIRTRADLGGGALFDLGVYPINAARNLFRDEPTEVFARCVLRDGVDETTTATLVFPGGRLAHFTVSLGASDVSTYRVVGSKGDLRVEPAFGYGVELAHHLTRNGRTRTRTFPKRDQFAAELEAFSRAILDGTEPEASGYEGLADVRVVEALWQSAETGRAIRLEPFYRERRPDMTMVMRKPWSRPPKPVGAPSPTVS